MLGLSLVAASRGYSLIVMSGLLMAMDSPAAHRLSGMRASVVAAHGLSCSSACSILVPGPGTKPVSPALAGRFLTTGLPGKSHTAFLVCVSPVSNDAEHLLCSCLAALLS